MIVEPVLPDYYTVLPLNVNTIKANGFIASHYSGQPRTVTCDPPQDFDAEGESTLTTRFHFKTKEFLSTPGRAPGRTRKNGSWLMDPPGMTGMVN